MGTVKIDLNLKIDETHISQGQIINNLVELRKGIIGYVFQTNRKV